MLYNQWNICIPIINKLNVNSRTRFLPNNLKHLPQLYFANSNSIIENKKVL